MVVFGYKREFIVGEEFWSVHVGKSHLCRSGEVVFEIGCDVGEEKEAYGKNHVDVLDFSLCHVNMYVSSCCTGGLE